MSQLLAILDGFVVRTAQLVRWLALAMVLATLLVVILRYVFNQGAIPLQESVMYMHGILFLLGIPYGLRQGTHVRVDILYARRFAPWQNHINLAGHCLFLLPLGIFITYTSWPYAAASWRVLEGSSEVGGLPAIFLLKTLITITAGLLTIQAVAEIVKSLRQLAARER